MASTRGDCAAGSCRAAATVVNAPEIPLDSNPKFLKYSPDMNLGEVLGIAVNSKGRIVVLNHPGSATAGPLYGNASTQLLEFDRERQVHPRDRQGRLRARLRPRHALRQVRQPLGRRQGDAGGDAVQPAGYVTLNLGRRSEGPDEPDYFRPVGARRPAAAARRRLFRRPDRRRVGLRRQHLHQRRLPQLARREVRQERQLGEGLGIARHRRRARPTRIRGSSTRRTTSPSIGRTTSTSPIATTAASRCSIATASSSASSS